MASVDVYIDSRHDALRNFLVGKDHFFSSAWELLAFAGAIGWQRGDRIPPPRTGKNNHTVKIFDDNRGDAVLADVLGVVAVKDDHDGNPVGAAAALNSDEFTPRCRELCAYAHGGLAIIEAEKERLGSYKQAMLSILDEQLEAIGEQQVQEVADE